jgi:hypothetical protein
MHSDYPNADLQNVIANTIKKVQACIDARGHHFQHFLRLSERTVYSKCNNSLYILRSAHTVYLCVLCGSENKRRLFHYTALTDWLL